MRALRSTAFSLVLFGPAVALRLPCKPRCGAVLCAASESSDELSFAALRKEVANRGTSVPPLGKFDVLKKIGPHHTTSPKEVRRAARC